MSLTLRLSLIMSQHCLKNKLNKSKLTTTSDLDFLNRLVVTATRRAFNLLYEIHSFNNLTKHDMLSIQPWGRNGSDEELRAIGIGTSIGHG